MAGVEALGTTVRQAGRSATDDEKREMRVGLKAGEHVCERDARTHGRTEATCLSSRAAVAVTDWIVCFSVPPPAPSLLPRERYRRIPLSDSRSVERPGTAAGSGRRKRTVRGQASGPPRAINTTGSSRRHAHRPVGFNGAPLGVLPAGDAASASPVCRASTVVAVEWKGKDLFHRLRAGS